MKDGKIIDTHSDEEMADMFVLAMKKDKIVIFPWETVYCLCFNISNPVLVERAYQIKGRPKDKKFPVSLPDASYLVKAGVIPNRLEMRYMERYWPGQLTIAFNDDFAANVVSGEFFRKMLLRLDMLIATTSANRSGCPSVTRAKEISPEVINDVDMVFLDDRKIYFPSATTVVRLKGKVEVLRQGPVILDNL